MKIFNKNNISSSKKSSIQFSKLFIISFFSVLSISCSKMKEDANLNGSWITESIGPNNQVMTHVYEFNGSSVKIVSSKNTDTFMNQIELRVGNYELETLNEGMALNINYNSNSCASIMNTNPTSNKVVYKLVDSNTVELTYGLNKKLTLKKLSDSEVRDLDILLKNSQVGCYTNNNQGTLMFVPTGSFFL